MRVFTMSRTKTKTPQLILLIQRLPEQWLVAGIMLVAAIARYTSITTASIWHDEGFTMMVSSRSPLAIWIGSGRDVHPPLYYELLHFWMGLFGRSELAARSMSAMAGLGTILIGYFLVKRYFGRGASTISLTILAIAPFLVRYSQEARMYGVLGLFLIAGTYALLRATEHQKTDWKWWGIYSLCMGAGLYTHYFTVLAMAAHWLYLMTLESPLHWKVGHSRWLKLDWWITNAVIVGLWLPWLPSFIGQFTRGQGIGWIPKSDYLTLPKSLWVNLTYTDALKLPEAVFWGVPILILGLILWVTWTYRKDHPQVKSIFWYTAFPIAATILISIIKPIYQDRYLVFAANGFYILLGLGITKLIRRHSFSGTMSLTLILIICGIGLGNVSRQATHSMSKVGNYVNSNYQTGDVMMAAELYTYFDFHYYCQHCLDSNAVLGRSKDQTAILKLNTSGGRPNGYGESALLYDRSDQIYTDNPSTVQPSSGRIWLIGKPGDKPYWKQTPTTWKEIDRLETNSSEVRLYQVSR